MKEMESSKVSSPDEDALTSAEEIRQALIDARKSDVFRRLQLYYEGPTVFDIVGVSRKEENHTRLLSWLFDPSASHGLGTVPLRRLLEAIVAVENNGQQEALDTDVRDRIVTGSYRIRSPRLTTEMSLDGSKRGRIDLFIEGDIEPPSAYRSKDGGNKMTPNDESCRPFRLLIENKVGSSEHDEQTERYNHWLNETRVETHLDLPLFLTPISTLELNALEEPECSCKEFIQINYQYLLDYVLVPCLQQDLGSQSQWILEEYAQSLSTSSNTENSAMALGEKERKLLNEFLEENSALFKSIMLAISQDESKSEEERKAANEYVEASKDRSDVQVLVDGEIEARFKYKADTGHEVIHLLERHDLLDDEIFEELRRNDTTGRDLLKRKKDMQGDEFDRRYRTGEGQGIKHNGETYYASSQWTADKVRAFEEEIQKLFPEEQIEIRLV